MRVLLCTVGSRGDIAPMLVLAEALRRHGHAVRVAAPPNFREWIEQQRFPFAAIGADTHQLIVDNQRLAERNPVLAVPSQIALLRRGTEHQIRDLLRDRSPAELVVGAGLAFGARAAADQLGAAYVYVCYTLAGVRAPEHPPAAMPLFGLPQWGNRLLWTMLVGSFDWAMQTPINRARTAHGLKPEGAAWRSVHAVRTLLAQDPLIGELPSSAQSYCEQVPALVSLAPSAQALPDAVERFLQQGSAASESGQPRTTAYVGFGSMPTVDRERVLAAVIELCRATGTRVLLYSAYAEDAQRALPSDILAVGSLDHRQLFPRVGWVVHHGGAGTTATALRAGAPQLIVPHIVDQFFHGRRIAELGLGPPPISKAKLDAKTLVDAFRESRRCCERARQVAAQLTGISGDEAAVHYLERSVSPSA